MENESCLGHRSVECVYNEENGVNHLKDTLYLTAEVSVAGSVYYVDPDALVINGRILCKDRNTSLTLQVVRVHNLLYYCLVLTVNACLLEHGVDDRCLAVVNVSDDRDIS